jgi:hypothetical protein
MFPNVSVSAAPFVYALVAIGVVCFAVVGVYIARDARRDRDTRKPRSRG